MRVALVPVVFAAFLVAESARADHPAIGFFVLHTSDVKQMMAVQGGRGLSVSSLQNKALAYGHAKRESSVWIKTQDFQVRIQIGTSPMLALAADEYAYDLTWYDQKQKRDVFSLRGSIKLGKDPTLPVRWDEKDITVVFASENLKQ